MILDMTVGQRLKELREAAGLTLEQAGRVAGTTKQSASQIEKGVTKVPGGLFLYHWSKRYGVSLEWLITGKGPKTEASPTLRLDADTILLAIKRMREATRKVEGEAIDVEADPGLFAEVLRLVLMEKGSGGSGRGIRSAGRSGGGASGAAGQAEAGEAERVATGGRRKRAGSHAG